MYHFGKVCVSVFFETGTVCVWGGHDGGDETECENLAKQMLRVSDFSSPVPSELGLQARIGPPGGAPSG